jgi:hypothetical protein
MFFGEEIGYEESTSDTMAFILGSLDEYMGRTWIDEDNLVEMFNIGEYSVVDVFVDRLDQYAEEEGIPAEVVRIETEARHEVYSKRLAQAINSHYTDVREDGFMDRDPPRRVYRGFASADMVEPGRKSAKIAYIAGAYMRYFRKGPSPVDPNAYHDCFIFGNSAHKVDLIITLLGDLECTDIRHELIVAYPNVHFIWFKPSPELSEALAEIDELMSW